MTRWLIPALTILVVGAATYLYAVFYAGADSAVQPSGGALDPPSVARSRAPEARIVAAFPGARIRQVFVTQGVPVITGQLLVQLELGDGAPPDDRISPVAMEAADSLLRRISPQMWKQLIVTDPQILTAEQEYADALLEDEHVQSQATRMRLRQATSRRLKAQDRLSRLGPGSMEDLAHLYRKNEEVAKWAARQRAASEVRTPIAGNVEIFDLHAGDKLPPSGRVALIAASPAKEGVQ